MSPMTGQTIYEGISFPRVSGDEPWAASDAMQFDLFSPREWG